MVNSTLLIFYVGFSFRGNDLAMSKKYLVTVVLLLLPLSLTAAIQDLGSN